MFSIKSYSPTSRRFKVIKDTKFKATPAESRRSQPKNGIISTRPPRPTSPTGEISTDVIAQRTEQVGV